MNSTSKGGPHTARFAAVALVVAGFAMLALPRGAHAQVKPDSRDVAAGPIEVIATPLAAFEKGNPERRRFGRLEWRGGLLLTSPSNAFGGWSGLVVAPDGKAFAAVSDAGLWMTGQFTYAASQPKGVTGAQLGPILALNAKTLTRNRDRDAEAIALVDGTLTNGEVLISFEGNHRIGRFPIAGGGLGPPTRYLEAPQELRRGKAKNGLEAMTVMRGGPWKGAVIAVAENFPDADGRHSGWLWVNGKPQRFALEETGGFDVTDIASLADGTLLVLERRFRWLEGVKMRLRQVRAGDVAPGAVLSGEVLIQADMRFEIDNMEGLAVHTGPAGETVLTILSDDNYNPLLQRTILHQFTLHPEALATGR